MRMPYENDAKLKTDIKEALTRGLGGRIAC
jgi:hypothetical protein